jgi:FolB domain-containing protein
MDKVFIKNLRAHGIIGIHPHEREIPQEILINVTVYTDTIRAAKTDDIADCIDYDALAKKLISHAESAARRTVEALANDLAEVCLRDQRIEKVILRAEKPDAVSSAKSVGVEVERIREQ